MNVNEHIALGHAKYKARLIKSGYPKHMLADAPLLAPDRVECKSGLKFSAQASSGHYCAPRNSDGPWALIELGFPNRRVPEFEEFGEPYSDVFGWVPVSVVDAVIEANGGFAD